MDSKVAWTCLATGLKLHLYDSNELQLKAARTTIENWLQQDAESSADISAQLQELVTFQDLSAALKGVNLAFENMPEQLPLKNHVHRQIHELLGTEDILTIHTSSHR